MTLPQLIVLLECEELCVNNELERMQGEAYKVAPKLCGCTNLRGFVAGHSKMTHERRKALPKLHKNGRIWRSHSGGLLEYNAVPRWKSSDVSVEHIVLCNYSFKQDVYWSLKDDVLNLECTLFWMFPLVKVLEWAPLTRRVDGFLTKVKPVILSGVISEHGHTLRGRGEIRVDLSAISLQALKA